MEMIMGLNAVGEQVQKLDRENDGGSVRSN